MYIRRLELVNFRCYRQLDLTLPKGPIVLIGANAQGKTSLLEAVFVLATTRAPYGVADRLLINWGAGTEVIPFSRAAGEIMRRDGPVKIDVVNARTLSTADDERYTKRLRVDDSPRRAMDVIGVLNVVLFTPRDIDLIHGAPAERRRYLDILLCQIDRGYVRALGRYNHVVVQRNHLLRRLRDRGGDRTELAVWNEALVTHGAIILARRLRAVRHLNDLAGPLHAELVGDERPLTVSYRSRVAEGGGGPAPAADAPADEDESAIAAAFSRLLSARRDEEIARGMSIVGPHRDDLDLGLAGIDSRVFGSRGQQRTVTLALKLAEAAFMFRSTGERPVLLLDDVLSELDRNRRHRLLAHVSAHEQSIITATDLQSLAPSVLADAHVFEIEAASVRPVTPDEASPSPHGDG